METHFARNLILEENDAKAAHLVLLTGVSRPEEIRHIGDGLAGVSFINPTGDVTLLLGTYRHRALALVGLSVLLMLPLMLWRYGRLGGLRVMLPPIAAVALTPALIALCGGTFTCFNALALVLVLAIGSDYAVFCRRDDRRAKGGDDARRLLGDADDAALVRTTQPEQRDCRAGLRLDDAHRHPPYLLVRSSGRQCPRPGALLIVYWPEEAVRRGLNDRKKLRTMGAVARMAVYATERALTHAGLLDDHCIRNGRAGIAYGSSFGSPKPVLGFAELMMQGASSKLTGTSYVQMMSYTAAVNIGLNGSP